MGFCFDGGFFLRNKETPVIEARANCLSAFICYVSPSLNKVVPYLLNNALVNVDNCLDLSEPCSPQPRTKPWELDKKTNKKTR